MTIDREPLRAEPTTNEQERRALHENGSKPSLPLVVDLDGTLVRSDTLVESLLLFGGRFPMELPRAIWWLLQGRTVLKEQLAARVLPDVSKLPYNQDLLAYLQRQHQAGRPIILATAAHRRIAEAVSAHTGLFSTVLATEGVNNLKGEAKLKLIRDVLGGDFVYAGDSVADLAVWDGCAAAVLVGTSESVRRSVQNRLDVELDLPRVRADLRVWIRALRVHQWSKNVLVLVPLFTAFAFFDLRSSARAVAAFLAFSLMASATYLVNDLLDLEKDRVHPTKRSRPVANASIPVPHAVGAAAILVIVALAISWSLPHGFGAAIVGYLTLTLVYSLRVKAMLLADVVMLACLFTTRIVAGALAIDVRVSVWLFAFSVFIFTSLALVKRCAELAISREGALREGITGRGYRASDLNVLIPLGVSTGIAAVLVFGLFVSAASAARVYQSPELLWLVCIGLLYWIARVWVKTSRGEMHDDPVLFALSDRASRGVLLCCLAVVVAARWLNVPALTY